MIVRSSSGTSIVWVCQGCGARDLALTESGFVAQVEGHLDAHRVVELIESQAVATAAETVARYARRHGV